MSKPNLIHLLLAGLVASSLVGCKNLPGSAGTQGAVIGGAGGATVGAVVGGGQHRLLGALLGGALGAAGGYIVGANSNRILGHDQRSAEDAAVHAQQHPATAQEALQAPTADLNNDGFVTLDEVVAMHDAGLTDAQMLDRMRATNQVFELTPDQRQYLLSRGIDTYVVDQMQTINQAARNQVLSVPPTTVPAPTALPPGTPPVISQPAPVFPVR